MIDPYLRFGAKKNNEEFVFSLPFPEKVNAQILLYEIGGLKPFLTLDVAIDNHIGYATSKNLPDHFEYEYLIDGQTYIDPYALELNTSTQWKTPSSSPLRGLVKFEELSKPIPLLNPKENLCIYEMHAKGFTTCSKYSHLSPFEAIAKLSEYFTDLGVNAIELMPIFEFDETRNYWGYSPLNFFSPKRSYGSKQQFIDMVSSLHDKGIALILDVVYNHTGDANWPFLEHWYFFDGQTHRNYSGCGNTLSCNSHLTKKLIISSLLYWHKYLGVDGFRFDLGSIFTRGIQGSPEEKPQIIEEILSHKDLQDCFFIMEPWDSAGLYQLGQLPHNEKFYQWNGRYRDTVRKFIRGDENTTQAFIQAIKGSPDLFQETKKSINFITAHDGFTLQDLVSYKKKHNENNGEDNRDGSDENYSENYGFEGTSTSIEIANLRLRQKKSFLLTLFISTGTPMLLMGDEYGHTRFGNNNAWCQDNELNWFLYGELEKNRSFYNFVKNLIHFRKQHLSDLSYSQMYDSKGIRVDNMNLLHSFYIDTGKFLIGFNTEKQKKHFSLHRKGHLLMQASAESDYLLNKDKAPIIKDLVVEPYDSFLLYSQ